MKKEVRKLTKLELNQLLNQGPKWSTGDTLNLVNENGSDAYEVFGRYGCEDCGVVIDDRPVYYGVLLSNGERYTLQTFINNDIKSTEHIAIYKAAKRTAQKWANKYGEIWSFIPKSLKLQQRWTLKMGFEPEDSTDDFAVSKLKKEEVNV